MPIQQGFDPVIIVKNTLLIINLIIFIILIQPSDWLFMTYAMAVFFSLIAIFMYWYNNIIFDRIMLSLYLYLITKSLLSMRYNLLHTHFIFPMLIAVGLYTTFLTQAGFIGIVGIDKKSILRTSLALLGIVIFVSLCAVHLRWPGQIAMFLVIAWAYGTLGRQMLSAQLNK